ncbi:lectin-like domain-containing protein [Companilactobacillus crustorum]|uniref:lectin-like domain-containing protein n=1 Tax=Companilactobacillus crustorum TaxID=392416 RepID=UPI000957AAE1|nr:hypothetical protein [Companilactobacillus crustorum]APU70793.1 hypothetical protein BI355_0441 [Companilactobacillus crustorum]
MKKILFLTNAIFIVFVLLIFFKTNTSASTVIPYPSSVKNNPQTSALLQSDDYVPDGIANITDWFHIASIPSRNNTTKIYPAYTSTSSPAAMNKTTKDVIGLTDSGYGSSYGAVWSNQSSSGNSKNNYIDINKNQTVSMWLMFGGGRGNVNYGDGMAFVLQNAGPNAFNKDLLEKGEGGQTMGVWGVPMTDTSKELIAKTAIQNSLAIEFDTYFNGDSIEDENASDSSYDHQLVSQTSGSHIAWNYPGDPNTYALFGSKNYVEMAHKDPVYQVNNNTNFLTDKAWHHMTIEWKPADTKSSDPTLTYKFDDEDLNGKPVTPGVTKSFPVDITKFNLNGNNKLYWGFTGSTGENTETNLVILDSVPAIVEASVDSELEDNTQTSSDGTPRKVNENESVNNGDDLSLKYNLSYDSGSQDWKNIIADINLPSHITYTNGTIKYIDGSSQAFSVDGSATDVTQTLEKDLSSTNKSATITINGTATADNSVTTEVAAEHASFKGSNLQKDVNSPAFKIIQPKKLTLTAQSSDNQTVKTTGQTTLSGQVAYSPTDTIDTSKIVIHRLINGKETPESDKAATLATLDTGSSADIFNYLVSADDLKEGANTVSFYAEDQDYNKSNTITYNINVIGDLTITAAPTSHFETVQSFPITRTIHRADDWAISVSDQRAINSTWKLNATATPLTKGDSTWDNGGLVFIDSKGNSNSLVNQVVNIAQGTKTSNGKQDFNIASSWSQNNGILLKQTSFEPKGTYSTTITWTAVDSSN